MSSNRKTVPSWLWWLIGLAGIVLVINEFFGGEEIMKKENDLEGKISLKVMNYNEFTSLTVEPGKTYKIVFNEPGKSGLVNLSKIGHFRIESDSGHYSWFSKRKEPIYEPPRGERELERETDLNIGSRKARLFIESRAESNEVTIKTWENTFN